jgi:hypothetical protein
MGTATASWVSRCQVSSTITNGSTSVKNGIYHLAGTRQRTLPTQTDSVTYEYIHSSVLEQENMQPSELREVVDNNPGIVAPLLPMEARVRQAWSFKPGDPVRHLNSSGGHAATSPAKHGHGVLHHLGHKVIDATEAALHLVEPRMHQEGGEPVYDATLLRQTGPFGKFLAGEDKE